MFESDFIGNAHVHRVLDYRLINFAQQSAMQLVQRDMKKHVSFRFPGPLPITIERRHTARIRSGGFMMTPKADGTRVLLILVRYFIENDWRKMSMLLHRDGTVHLVMINLADRLYENNGSIFDAEIITHRGGNGMLLVLFDCYAFCGISISHQNLQTRLSRIERTLNEFYNCGEHDSVRIMHKPYYTMNKDNLPDALAFMSGQHYLEYNTDGIVLVHNGPMNKCGTNDDQFKMKSNHTLDLILVEDDGCLYLASLDEADDSYVVKQEVHQSEMPDGATAGCVMECGVTLDEGMIIYRPYYIRTDKTAPNVERVIERTLQTIRDGITLESLIVH